MNIFNCLKKDHEKVEQLLNRLVAASESGDPEWRTLVTQIRDELIPHARAEEALVYNPIRDTEHGKDVVGHSYLEHAKAETELRALQAFEKVDANWTALAKKLREDILHHVEEEESKVFAAGRMVFSEEEAQNIGAAFEQLKPYVKEQGLMGTTLDLVKNLIPSRFHAAFNKKAA